ncbi:MAG: winged helix-turn-helix transcriptional regulator [Solirubrobacterales bacterium]|nr:winged helix-turn-helix transcriptional regulator [Solirubrobacterales bacterium]
MEGLVANGVGDPHELLVALGHPRRRQILRAAILGKRPISPRELADEMDLGLSNVSYHVRVLMDCKVLDLTGTKAVRGSVQHFYVANAAVSETPWVREALELGPPDAD